MFLDRKNNHVYLLTRSLQVELVVMVQGSTELHGGDMELLPIRAVGAETETLSPFSPDFTVSLGPLCFL